MKRIDKIIEDIELDYIEFIGGDIDSKKKLLPLSSSEQITGLIWNLLISDKWRERISYKDFSHIINVWTKRLK